MAGRSLPKPEPPVSPALVLPSRQRSACVTLARCTAGQLTLNTATCGSPSQPHRKLCPLAVAAAIFLLYQSLDLLLSKYLIKKYNVSNSFEYIVNIL